MKVKNYILLICLFMVSQDINSQSKTINLPVIDFSKNYPAKEIRLQDIADSEYIPLETTDDALLSDKAVLTAVSDKFILVYEPLLGDIFVFNRNGKIHAHFNHKGQSGQEYAWIRCAILDDKNEEIFICNQIIQVYSLNGKYKRTLKINTLQNESAVYNFDDEALLLYDNVIIDSGFEHKTKKKPYRLMSKKDGSLITVLNISFSKRYSPSILQKEGKYERAIQIYYPSSIYYGSDFMIANISSDTLYKLTQNKKITPVLVRKPSVHASEPRKVWTTHLTTDKFMIIGEVLLDFDLKGGKIPIFMYEYKTGKINKVEFLDTKSEGGTFSFGSSPAIAKNMTAQFMQAPSFISIYKKMPLKGSAKKSVMPLREDDNPIVRIIKFK
ncbi:MAG: 6-bladed beta-propeller [Macellibacteroides fermentans]|uniref:6-bladed beta-propeller n=1 Tax=Macellibacteroides fermentans TaxID=879969 RepID=UPI003ACB2F96